VIRAPSSLERRCNTDTTDIYGPWAYATRVGVYHPETGAWLASVKDGKITAPGGVSYSLVGDMIVTEDGTEIGYLGPFIGLTKGTGDLCTRLFPR
jgi:hypothetical protein